MGKTTEQHGCVHGFDILLGLQCPKCMIEIVYLDVVYSTSRGVSRYAF